MRYCLKIAVLFYVSSTHSVGTHIVRPAPSVRGLPRKRVGETLKSLHPCLFDPMPLQDTLRQSVSFLYLENHSLGEWFIGRLLSIMKTEKLPLLYIYNRSAVWQLHKIKQWEVIKMNDVNSLSHTSWNCKYHIVFAPKYRRKVFYGQKRKEIRLRERG